MHWQRSIFKGSIYAVCLVKDAPMSIMKREVADHLWWTMILLKKSTKRLERIGDSQLQSSRSVTLRSQEPSSTKLWVKNFVDHPPYSLDLDPIDFHLFANMKKWLGAQCFVNNDELKDRINEWLNEQAAEFYSVGIEKLLYMYDKC